VKPVRVRITLLLLALLVAAAWTYAVRHRRESRRSWERTLAVAVVVVAAEPVAPAAMDVLRSGLERLGERMRAEAQRRRPGAAAPFAFELWGPAAGSPPPLPEGGSLWARAREAYVLWRALRAIDGAVPDFDASSYDARIYLALEPPGSGPETFAEGAGQAGGEVGLVRARVSAGQPVLAMQAIGHELLHCLGATDKYSAEGHALPDGLADPGRRPLYPQVAADFMGVEVALGPASGRLPRSFDELAVGPATAAEIGWAPWPERQP
jgi:hypothetical protein